MSNDSTLVGATVPADEQEQLSPLPVLPSSEPPQYYCLLTAAGAELQAQCHAQAKPLKILSIAVGDGNGQVPTPTGAETGLVGEKYRKAIDSKTVDEDDKNICWLHMVIPADIGGFWIREFAVFAESLTEGGAPVCIAYGNHSPYYKVKRVLGQALTHEISVPLVMSATADVEIVISETGYASRLELLHLSGVVESLRHRQRKVWTISEAVESGNILTLPTGMKYVPGLNVLDVSMDGVILYEGQNYSEVPAPFGSTESSSIRLSFTASAGSEFRVVVSPYSKQGTLPSEGGGDVEERVTSLETNLLQLSEAVAYINDGSQPTNQ